MEDNDHHDIIKQCQNSYDVYLDILNNQYSHLIPWGKNKFDEFIKNELKILITKKEIEDKIKFLGNQISKDYKNKEIIVIGVLKGSFIFLSDLVRNISCDMKIDFIQVSSYQGENSTGKILLKKNIDSNIFGKNILIVEDIIDTGTTIDWLKHYFSLSEPKSIKICSLFIKKNKIDMADYYGFEIGDEFIIGYGLDYNEYYRNLDHIRIFSEKN